MREYYRRQLQLNFAKHEEREDFDNLLLNLKHKTGITRVDQLVMMGIKLLEEKVNYKKNRNNS